MERSAPLARYHYVWLRAHPERSEDWLREKFREGFDVHHLDRDKTNEHPDNLILIEHLDHMRLHGFKLNRFQSHNRRIKKRHQSEVEAEEDKKEVDVAEALSRYDFRDEKTYHDYLMKALKNGKEYRFLSIWEWQAARKQL